MNIHIITVLNIENGEVKEQMVVGWKRFLTMAADFVEHNVCDIHDSFFKYAVIEEIEEGIYPVVEKEYWFEWKEGKYKEINKPKELEGLMDIWRYSVG